MSLDKIILKLNQLIKTIEEKNMEKAIDFEPNKNESSKEIFKEINDSLDKVISTLENEK